MHNLSPVTDNYPALISGRKRMSTEKLIGQISMKNVVQTHPTARLEVLPNALTGTQNS